MLPKEFIKRSYSLSYATFRLSDGVNNPAIQQSIENTALKILVAGLEGDLSTSRKVIKELEYVVALGRDAGHIYPYAAELLLAEIQAFSEDTSRSKIASDLKPRAASSPEEDISFEELFPSDAHPISQKEGPLVQDPQQEELRESAQEEQSGNPAIADLMSSPALTQQGDESFISRKEKILNRIRQSGNCRMRDIQEVMGDVSERTLRYDLQRLVAEGLIERVGSGGPATYYRIK